MSCFILLDDRKSTVIEKKSLFFTHPTEEIICNDPEQLVACIEKIEKLKQNGCYLAGFVSYEASYFLQPSIIKNYVHSADFPLLHFMAFADCQQLTQAETDNVLHTFTKECVDESFAYDISLNMTEDEYEQNIQKIKNHLFHGDTYQVNYTGKYTFGFQGNPIKLYQALRERQKVHYGALLHFKDYQILSLSPELFFSKQDDQMTVKPMKGSMPRSSIPELDQKNRDALTTDAKLIAENIIIVDLLRNDLSSISHPGSVSVSSLLGVETYETIHQMTSTIHSKVNIDTSFETVLQHLFPCGSITGAPKRRTMQIIQECEKEARHIYTGTIGYITPENNMCFNVAIRTLLLKDNKGELGIGGGIINDSNAKDEHQEVVLKAKFFTEMDTPFRLIESMKYHAHSGIALLERHLKRLKESALFFNFMFDEKAIRCRLQEVTSVLSDECSYKIRLINSKNGGLDIEATDISDLQPPKTRVITLHSAEYTQKENILLQHKTTDSTVRQFYNRVFSTIADQYYDVIFMNQDGFITESSRANIFIQLKGKILTPITSCGLLPGIMRQKLLEENASIEQTCISSIDVHQAEKIWLTNSVRGIEEVVLCND